ncbi:MAG: hypothetical protein ABSE15_04380 [Candidatus Bathyarchaeia archaeon]
MEKVWEELKKIEAEAEKILGDAQQKSKDILALTQLNSEKLASNSKNYAEAEGQEFFASAVEEANRKRDEQLKANQAATEKLKRQAVKRMERAVTAVVDAIVKEAKP